MGVGERDKGGGISYVDFTVAGHITSNYKFR